MLKCLGLAWDTPRPGTKGTVKKASAGGSALTMNLAFSKPPTDDVEPVYGRAQANFAPATQSSPVTNPRGLAI